MQKFENMDVLESLRAIMQIHTKHFQSDFDTDVQTLKTATESQNLDDKIYVWMCRLAGTWCFRERDVFIKGTNEHNTFCFYAEQTSNEILVYVVELIGFEKGKVIGNLYEMDYQKYYEHVRDVSIPAGDTRLIYERGELMQEAGKPISGNDNPRLGKFLCFEMQPREPEALRSILRNGSCIRDRAASKDFQEYVKKLSNREEK